MLQDIFGKKTVASVLSVFSKTITELETVEREQTEEALRQADNILQASEAHKQAIMESSAARDVIVKMQNIINPVATHFGAQSLKEEI